LLSTPQVQELLERTRRATGSDSDLDAAIAAGLGPPAMGKDAAPPFTRSIEACLDLLHRRRPGWAWHIGWDANGVMPYVTLSKDERRYEARASTLPLALLDVLLQVEITEPAGHGSRCDARPNRGENG
jgi:hypothetical protein